MEEGGCGLADLGLSLRGKSPVGNDLSCSSTTIDGAGDGEDKLGFCVLGQALVEPSYASDAGGSAASWFGVSPSDLEGASWLAFASSLLPAASSGTSSY